MAKRAETREYRVSLFDGRGTAAVYRVDGYGRAVSEVVHVTGVYTERDAIAAAVAAGL